MARANYVKAARKDYPDHGIKKGESYWWWKFRFGGKHYSKTRPKQSQLTQSEFLSTIYGIEEQLADLNADNVDDLKDQVEDIISQIREAGDECEEKRSNMPDQLQDSETGELLQNRKDECDAFADELEGVDLDDFDDSEIEGNEDEKTEAYMEWIGNKIDELQSCSYNGE